MAQRHRLLRVLSEVDPTPRQLARRSFPGPEVTAVVVYRDSSPPGLGGTVDAMASAGFDIAAWSLDGHSHPQLDGLMVGSGPSPRFAHFNRLVLDVTPERYVLLFDDDVVCHRGDAATFVGLAVWFDFDIAQPAHGRGSYASFPFPRPFPGHVARQTTFVEIGPLLLLSPRARREATPFRDEGMGWGTEVDWYLADQAGLRLGIIDGVEIRHLRPPGSD